MIASPSPATGSSPGRFHGLLLLGVLLAGCVLRARQYGTYWLNPDEGIYFTAITRDTFGGFWAPVLNNAHPPLFYLLQRAWAAVSDDLLWLRLPVLLAGCAAVYAAYLLGRELADRWSGLTLALAVAVLPPAIEQSQILRPYSLVLCLLLLALAAFARAVRSGGRAAGTAYGLAMATALATHYCAFIVLGGIGLTTLLVLAASPRRRQLVRPLVLMQVLPTAAALTLYWLHIRPHLQGSSIQAEAQTDWLRSFFPTDAESLKLNVVGVAQYFAGSVHRSLALTLLALSLPVTLLARRFLLTTLTLTSVAVALLLAFQRQYPLGCTRHSLYLAAVLLPPVACALTSMVRHKLGWLPLAALLVLAARPASHPEFLDGGEVPQSTRPEQLITREDMQDLDPTLQQIRETPGLLLLSRQTFYTLAPYFRNVHTRMQKVEDARLNLFPWGERQAILSTHWSLTAEPQSFQRDNHLARLLVAAKDVDPALSWEQQPSAWLLVAGWSQDVTLQFALADRQKPKHEILGTTAAYRGVAALELNLTGYTAALRLQSNDDD